MQPYRTAKPHDAAECRLCVPQSPGHHLCQHDGCQQPATMQVQRHATAEQYAQIPETLKPIDGVATKAVFACDDHGESVETFCEHPPAPEPAPCPRCGKNGHEPCVTTGGRPFRGVYHAVRPTPRDLPPETCTHAHREDCRIFEGCACTQHDPLPQRPPRVVPPPPPPGPAPIHLPVHGPMLAVLTAHGIDVDRVIHNELAPKGDGSNVVVLTVTMVVRQANGDLSYDEHGKPVAETRQIELVIPRPTDPVEHTAL